VSVSIVLNHVTLLLSIGTNFVNGKKEGAKELKFPVFTGKLNNFNNH
jgi:hypothetical protein